MASILNFEWFCLQISSDVKYFFFSFQRHWDQGLIVVIVSSSSSSSSCAISMNIADPLSLLLPIVHCFRQALRATSCIGTELLYIGLSWSSCLCSSMWRGPLEYITYELVPTSPAVSCMSGSSKFDSFCEGWSVAV